MNTVVTWELLTGIFSFIAIIIGIWWRLHARIERSEDRLNMRVHDLKDDVTNYKLEAAQTFATSAMVAQSYDKVHKSIDQQNTQLNRLHSRLDKLFERTAS